jgi:hypothetical protein
MMVEIFLSAAEERKKAQVSAYCTEAVGCLPQIREPTPKRELFTYRLVALKFPTFQYKTQSESFKQIRCEGFAKLSSKANIRKS